MTKAGSRPGGSSDQSPRPCTRAEPADGCEQYHQLDELARARPSPPDRARPAPLATPGATYTLTGAAAGTTVLSGYSAALTCTDANGVQTGLPAKAAFSGSAAITPVAGADVACILTNTAKTATAEPSLGITKSASPSVITAAGQVVTYTVVATNTGNVTLNDVEVTDTLAAPAGPPIVLTCNPTLPATLAPGATVTCTGSYVATASDLSHGDISNTATVTGHSPSGVLVDKSASATVTTEAATAWRRRIRRGRRPRWP